MLSRKTRLVHMLITYVFRLGSGAAARFTLYSLLLWCLPMVATANCGTSLRGCVPDEVAAVTVETDGITLGSAMSSLVARPELKADGFQLSLRPVAGVADTRFLLAALSAANLVLVLALVCLMMPAQGGSSSTSRDPPAWGPEMSGRYSFVDWTRDL